MIELNEEQSLDELEVKRIHDGLVATDPVDQPRHYAPLFLSLRDSDLRLVGGVLASTVWNWRSIDALWVNPELRGQGYGSRLVARAEQVARSRGCTHARLDTFDYQARVFYERLGYSVYAQLAGFLKGHTQLHMTKLLPLSSRGDR
ncbi:MAG: GNAT family N-acetyltransferase [Gemmatimonadaceae bacterium]